MSIPPSSSKVNTAIVCKDIYKTYGQGEAKVQALRGVSLHINQGELRLLMGPSGSGKTTLISIISGILTQDSGECLLYPNDLKNREFSDAECPRFESEKTDSLLNIGAVFSGSKMGHSAQEKTDSSSRLGIEGTDLSHLPDKEKTYFRGRNIGFVFQSFNLIPMLTVEENVSIPLRLAGMARKEALERSKQVLSELNMDDKIGKTPPELSGGQQQRVAIARAIVHSPHFIVCDEPTSFLDHQTGTKIMEQLQHLVRKNNVTIIVVTHDPRIVSFADTIDHLEDGRIVNNS